MSFRSLFKLIALCSPVAIAPFANAQISPDSAIFADQRLEETIVTADFYETPTLKIPGSVTILGQQDIKQRNAEHLEQLLGLAPNVNFATGASRGRFIQIRGIGERSEFIEPVNYSVGVLIDGIDFTGISTAASTLDIEQVEILRGPQGTLYGANALAGLINIVSTKPTEEAEGNLQLSVANYNSRTLKGAIGGSLTDSLGYRIAVQNTQSDGFFDNSFLNQDDTNDIDETTFRAKLALAASEDLTLNLTAFYADIDNGYDVFNYESTRTTRSNQPGHDRQETTALALSADYQISDSLALETSLSTADSDIEYGYDEDWRNPILCTSESCTFGPDGYHSAFDNYERDNENTSLDVRLKSDSADWNASWVLGFYYRDQSVDLTRTYTSGYGDCCDVNFSSDYDTRNSAIYGDWSAELTEKLSYSLGARFEQRDSDYIDSDAFGFSTSENLWGAKVSLNYQVNDDQMAYATISRGYKPGGANSNSAVPEQFREYDTETMVNYELGLKGYFLNGQLETQVALFYQDRSDIQIDSAIVNCPGTGQPCTFTDFVTNADSGENYGIETQLSFLLSDSTKIFTSLGLLNTSYGFYENFRHVNRNTLSGDGVNLEGRDQPQAPSYQFIIGIDSAITEELAANLNLEGKDSFFLSNDHDVRSSSYVLVNANLTYQADQWSASLWGKNLTDKDYQNRAFGSFPNDPRDGYSTNGPYFQLSDPRTFGITGRYDF